MVLIFLMLMALLSAILRMQEFFIAGIDALFPWCAMETKHMNEVSKNLHHIKFY